MERKKTQKLEVPGSRPGQKVKSKRQGRTATGRGRIGTGLLQESGSCTLMCDCSNVGDTGKAKAIDIFAVQIKDIKVLMSSPRL